MSHEGAIDEREGATTNREGATTDRGDGVDGTLTMYADYVCPFCYLGEASLEQYLDGRERALDVEWHPFDLRGGKRRPDGSIDHEVADGKDEAYFEQARENVRRLQERYGVEMELEIASEIDSKNAQLAALYVREEHPERFAAFHGAVFDALWQHGRDIGDPDVLAEIAAESGVDPEGVRAALTDDALDAELHERFAAAREAGVTGVPTFAYDGHAARGAVPPEHLQRLIEG